jgi:acetyltransferase-like isoleucine patch superfamily enzyme
MPTLNGNKMNLLRKIVRHLYQKYIPESQFIFDKEEMDLINSYQYRCELGNHVNINKKYNIENSKIGDYTYIAPNSHIFLSEIGKFCSIGPNFLCGWGLHPTNGLSTSPMFYSTMKQNGITLSQTNKVIEQKPIKIGNDVFIGANVTVLDGITIGDGAVIGAGAVVSKNIPPYAIAVGCPIQIIKQRFEQKQIDELLRIQWWNFSDDKLKDVEMLFFDIDDFIMKYK